MPDKEFWAIIHNSFTVGARGALYEKYSRRLNALDVAERLRGGGFNAQLYDREAEGFDWPESPQWGAK